MSILYLHGWNSSVGGVKPSYLIEHGWTLHQPALPHDDFAEAVRIAQEALEQNQPRLIVGSSRGGAVAMNLQAGAMPLLLLCPAWKRWGSARTVKPGTLILHAVEDEVVPFSDSQELLRHSGLDEASALIVTGHEHRLADPAALQALLDAVQRRMAGAAPQGEEV